MILKMKQLFNDLLSYINSLPVVDDIKEYYDSLQEREKNILKIVALVLIVFIVFSIFSNAISNITEAENKVEQLESLNTELNIVNKLILEKGRANFKTKDYLSLTALLEECENEGVFAVESKIDTRESSKNIERGKFKEYRVWSQYEDLTLAQVIKFLACVENPSNTVKISSLKIKQNLEHNNLLDIEFEASYRLKGKNK